MKLIVTLMALLVVGCVSTHKSFYLRSAQTGMLAGPFVYRDSTYLPPSECGYLIAQPRPGEFQMMRRLKSLELKDVAFRQTSVSQVVATLNAMQVSQLGRVAVPIGIDLESYRRFAGADHPANREDSTDEDWRLCELRRREVPSLTMSYSHISLFELLHVVMFQTGLPLNIDGKSVTFSQRLFQKAASDPTSEGVRQPANGSPNPSM